MEDKWISKMENRIYYGEYSLKHWIEMLLKKKITLPEYQRSFVWSDKAVKRFIKSLKEKQFIPPVTIAHYKIENEDKETNYILDGQQSIISLRFRHGGEKITNLC